MGSKHRQAVRRELRKYADRGVFRGFAEERSGNGKLRFKFVWLVPNAFEFCYDVEKSTLAFNDLLPGIPIRSVLYAELKELVREKHQTDLPVHRRIDRTRAVAKCVNRRGKVTLVLHVKGDEYEYGVRRLVNLVHEVFLSLGDLHPDYLSEHFNVSQE